MIMVVSWCLVCCPQSLPERLNKGQQFDSKVDCEAVSMACAESMRMRWKQKSGLVASQNLNLRCVGCSKFCLHFGARGGGEKVGEGGLIESGRCWVINKAELTHSEDCNLASKIDKCNPAYTNRVLAFSILPALQRDKAQSGQQLVSVVKEFVRGVCGPGCFVRAIP